MPDSSTTPQADSDGQGPAQVTIPAEPSAATEVRDQLLAAIGAEARNLEKYPGQASAQLAELARAYALVTTASATLEGAVRALVMNARQPLTRSGSGDLGADPSFPSTSAAGPRPNDVMLFP